MADHERVHSDDKPYSCDICKISFSERSTLSLHFKTSTHLNSKESKDLLFHKNTFIDCDEDIKKEDIKGEINEEESVDDPLSFQQGNENSNICKDIKEEVKEEEGVDDPLSIQEVKRISENDNICTEVKEEDIGDPLFVQQIHNFGDYIDINEHKIEI